MDKGVRRNTLCVIACAAYSDETLEGFINGTDRRPPWLTSAWEEIEQLRKDNEEISSICFRHGIDTPDGSSVSAVKSMAEAFTTCAAQRDRALEAVEKLREALAMIESESNLSDSGHLGRHGMGDVAREALAATEPIKEKV